MNNRLGTIVDLEKYPIHNLESPVIKKLIEKCKKELNEFSCSTIPNFILPKSLEIMNSELESQLNEVYMSKESINAYLYSKDDVNKKYQEALNLIDEIIKEKVNDIDISTKVEESKKIKNQIRSLETSQDITIRIQVQKL